MINKEQLTTKQKEEEIYNRGYNHGFEQGRLSAEWDLLKKEQLNDRYPKIPTFF